jgi:hypothetical protein
MKRCRILTIIAILPALLLLTCGQPQSTSSAKAVLEHHLQAVSAGNLDEIMADYTADAVLYTPDGPLRGTAAIRGFFATLPEILPPGFWENFKMIRQDTEGEVAYMVWSSEPAFPLGTDTFIIRDGRIVTQTFAAHVVLTDSN